MPQPTDGITGFATPTQLVVGRQNTITSIFNNNNININFAPLSPANFNQPFQFSFTYNTNNVARFNVTNTPIMRNINDKGQPTSASRPNPGLPPTTTVSQTPPAQVGDIYPKNN